jgi:GrpB-like predicted nucleotidyltransferase (UPF0157 family)
MAAPEAARLGAGDGPIEIVEYDPRWPTAYVAERERLSPLLPGVPIHHIGSSAVRGLAGKAVIDMIALVEDLEASSATVMQGAGYQRPGQFNADLVHRRFLCYPTATYRTHHLHLVDAREDMDRCLRFRDRLRANSQLAADYVALKRALAADYKGDRMGYTKAKTRFIDAAHSQPGVSAEEA